MPLRRRARRGGQPGPRSSGLTIGEALLARSAGLSDEARAVLRVWLRSPAVQRPIPWLRGPARSMTTGWRTPSAKPLRPTSSSRTRPASELRFGMRCSRRPCIATRCRESAVGSTPRSPTRSKSTAPRPVRRSPSLISELAHHWYGGGGSTTARSRRQLAAGDLAASQAAHAAAFRHYERVVELWEQAPLASGRVSHGHPSAASGTKRLFRGRAARTRWQWPAGPRRDRRGVGTASSGGGSHDLRLARRITPARIGDGGPLREPACCSRPRGLPLLERKSILTARVQTARREGDVAAADGVHAVEIQRSRRPRRRSRPSSSRSPCSRLAASRAAEHDGERARRAAPPTSHRSLATPRHTSRSHRTCSTTRLDGGTIRGDDRGRAHLPATRRSAGAARVGTVMGFPCRGRLAVAARTARRGLEVLTRNSGSVGRSSRWLSPDAAAAVEIDRGELSRAAEHLGSPPGSDAGRRGDLDRARAVDPGPDSPLPTAGSRTSGRRRRERSKLAAVASPP